MKKILFVDDSKVQLMLATKFSREIDPTLEIITETSGERVLEFFDEIKDHLLLAVLDFNMEPLNGFELMERLATQFPVERILICTANAQQVLADKIRQRGGQFMVKPLTKEKLAEVIASAKSKHKASA